MPDSDVHEAIQLDADITALSDPTVSELWRAMHGYPAEATGAVAAHRAMSGSSSYTDAVWIHANPSGTTFAGNVNEAFAFADISVMDSVGTDLSLVEFAGGPAFQTEAGGVFRISVGLDMTPTLDAGSALQRVMQFAQAGYDQQIQSSITMPFVMVDGVDITGDFPGPELLNLPAGTVFGQAPAYIPLNSIAADSYYVFYNAMVVRLAPLPT